VGKGERSRAETPEHHVSISPKEDRGGTAGKVGEVESEARKEGGLGQRSQSLASFCVGALQIIISSLAAFYRCRG
jgi:hypothetical protein